MRNLLRLLAMVWRTGRMLAAAVLTLQLVSSLASIATLWIGKLLIDTLVATQQRAPQTANLLMLLALEGCLVLLAETSSRASQIAERILTDRLSHDLSGRLIVQAATIDLAQMESPEIADRLDRARAQIGGQMDSVSFLLAMTQDALLLVGLAAAIVAVKPWLLFVLLVATIPSALGETRYAILGYRLFAQQSPLRRSLDYLRQLGTTLAAAKEVRAFGLASWIAERYHSIAQRYQSEVNALAIERGGASAGLWAIGTLGYYGAYMVLLLAAANARITIGSLGFLGGSLLRIRAALSRLLRSAASLKERGLYLQDLFKFFDQRPAMNDSRAYRAPPFVRQGIVAENVGFRYPGSARWVLRGVNLCVRPGERLALVGENGSGKTTLVKLLLRLYDPTEGRILFEGVDLRDYDRDSLRAAFGVVFQDAVKYDMTFAENIGVGNIAEVREFLEEGVGAPVTKQVPRRLADAADRSLANTLLARLPYGYQQQLGRRFEGGIDLSGGEWQKVALARAYLCDAQLLVLDEPTSAVDARREHETFCRFAELIGDRMAVLISHRFSTVRAASRIVVLSDGRVLETGTHDDLLAEAGLYAQLFTLQASAYR